MRSHSHAFTPLGLNNPSQPRIQWLFVKIAVLPAWGLALLFRASLGSLGFSSNMQFCWRDLCISLPFSNLALDSFAFLKILRDVASKAGLLFSRQCLNLRSFSQTSSSFDAALAFALPCKALINGLCAKSANFMANGMDCPFPWQAWINKALTDAPSGFAAAELA
jgi:hypothetical protein